MFCIIIMVTVGIGYFALAKNPVEQCKHWYKDMREGREYIHKPNLNIITGE